MIKRKIDKERIKTVSNRWLNVLNKVSIVIDILVISRLLSYFNNIQEKDTMQSICFYGLIVLLVVLLYRYIRAWVFIIKSKMDREVYLLANRVVAIGGKQRVGKTSLSVYFAKYGKKAYTNIPMRINKKYTNKLTTDILTLKTRIEDKSILLVDEANLFYNNTMSHEEKTLYGQALLCQCVGHFFDGNILYIATDINRLPKILRDNWSSKLQVLRSKSYNYSMFGNILLKALYVVVNGESLKYTGIRLWDCQQYEQILQEQYISLLGQTEKDNKFSPFYTYADFQGIGSVEYEDRYMQAYYMERPENIDITWDNLQLSKEDFKTLYDGLLSTYIKALEDDLNKPKQVSIKVLDNGNVQNNTDSQ